MTCPRFSFHALLVAGALCAVFSAPVRAQLDVDPSDLYLKAYLVMRDAEKLKESHQFNYSYEKFLEATELFDSVAHSYPSWNPHMVNFRRKKIRESISELKSTMNSQVVIAPGSSAPPSPAVGQPPRAPSPTTSSTPAQLPYVTEPLPLPSYTPPRHAAPAPKPNVVAKIPEPGEIAPPIASGRGSSINAATSHIETKFRELRARITQLDTEKQHLHRRLLTRESELKLTRRELADAKKSREALEAKLAESASMLKLNAATDSKKLEALTEEVATLTAQLKIAKVSLETAAVRTDSLLTELRDANAEAERLKEERSQLIAERHQMTALIGDMDSDGSLDVRRLMAINENLRRQLNTARENAEKLAEARSSDKEQIAKLKAQVAAVTEELSTLKSDNETYRVQIAQLTERLESTSQDLSGSSSNLANAEALEENQMLREIILRQLRQQARRQQAKELVMVELAKLEINSNNLLNHIEDLAGSRVILSDKERALFRDSYVAPLIAGSDMHGMLISENPPPAKKPAPRRPASDAKSQMARIAIEASRNFETGNYAEAEGLYEKLIKLDRQNIYSLCNLGNIKLRLGKHDDAEVLFSKALAYDPKHAHAHFMLGITNYERQNYDASLESISHAVQLNPNNAQAHQYLGLIASHKGWVKRAEQEFKKAIAIDPEFAEAYFNLSILYITAPDSKRDRAQEHYLKALDFGAKPDPIMEDYLRG